MRLKGRREEARYRRVRSRFASLKDLMLAALEAAIRVQDMHLPPDRLEHLLRERTPHFDPWPFLTGLDARAQLALNWTQEQLPRGLPIDIGLLSLEETTSFAGASTVMAELKLRPVVSLDPYAVTVLRLCHGLSLDAVPHFQTYREDAQAVIDEGKRQELVLARGLLWKDGQEYLGAPDAGDGAGSSDGGGGDA